MNYIELINNFWAKAQKDDLKPIPIACWFALVHYCNQLNWLNPFVAHWSVVCQLGNFSKNSFYDAIKTLDELGYIKYKKGNRNQSLPKITILELKNNKGTVERTIKEQQQEHFEEHKGNLYKQINNQTIKPLNDEPRIDWTLDKFESDRANEIWVEWLKFKIECGEPVTRVRQPYVKNKLKKMATFNGVLNESIAVKIIDKCLTEGWKNLQLTDEMQAKIKQWQQN